MNLDYYALEQLARIEAIKMRGEAMKSGNQQRAHRGESVAWPFDSFSKLAEELEMISNELHLNRR